MHHRHWLALSTFALGLALACPNARADENIVRDPDRHPHHAFEAEPHALIAPLGPGPLPGVGFRGTFTLSEDGFIRSINDSVGLGVGIDWTRDNAYVPVVMQWNFWLRAYRLISPITSARLTRISRYTAARASASPTESR